MRSCEVEFVDRSQSRITVQVQLQEGCVGAVNVTPPAQCLFPLTSCLRETTWQIFNLNTPGLIRKIIRKNNYCLFHLVHCGWHARVAVISSGMGGTISSSKACAQEIWHAESVRVDKSPYRISSKTRIGTM